MPLGVWIHGVYLYLIPDSGYIFQLFPVIPVQYCRQNSHPTTRSSFSSIASSDIFHESSTSDTCCPALTVGPFPRQQHLDGIRSADAHDPDLFPSERSCIVVVLQHRTETV